MDLFQKLSNLNRPVTTPVPRLDEFTTDQLTILSNALIRYQAYDERAKDQIEEIHELHTQIFNAKIVTKGRENAIQK
jgi:hypothetical protein